MIKELKPIGDEMEFSLICIGEFFEYNSNIFLKVELDMAFNCDTEHIVYDFTPTTKVRWRDFIIKEV